MADPKPIGWLGKAWIGGVVAYAILRALIVWPTLGEYGVSPWVFLVIDVGTAWPYAYGQVRVIRAARRRDWADTQVWSLITLLSFLAPYLYIVGAGSQEMPLLAYIIVGALMVAFGTASVVRVLKQVRAPVSPPEPETT